MILESIAKCLANSNVSYNNLVELIDRCLLIMVLVLGGGGLLFITPFAPINLYFKAFHHTILE